MDESPSSRVARAAVLGLAVVLFVLSGFALWAALTSRSAERSARRAVSTSQAYSDARFAVGQLESLERKYRLEPGPAVLAKWRAAGRDLLATLGRVRLTDERGTTRLVAALERRDGAYRQATMQMFAAVDAHQARKVLAIDSGQVDPQFGVIEQTVDREAGLSRREAASALRSLSRTEHLVSVLTPLAFAIGLALLALFGSILRAYQRRISEASRLKLERLEHVALTDSLTGLRNHRAFQEDLAREVERAHRTVRPLSLVIFDVDDLKRTNDERGHQAGDDLLRSFATAIRETTRAADSTYRIGGDEFATILAGERAFGALEYTHRVQARLAEDNTVSATGGIAEAREVTDRDGLFRQADLALIDAKRSHRRAMIYTPASDVVVELPDVGRRRHQRAVLATSLARAVDAKDAYTRSHCETVAALCSLIGDELGIEPERLAGIRMAGLLHDVGKIGIPDAILQKPAQLDDDEFETMKTHSVLGESILAGAELIDEAHWVRHHHERMDGRGYPDGLRGDAIPLESRIILVADAFEAMTADRPYRKGRAVADAIAELERHAGTQFDARCVAALVSVLANPPPSLEGMQEGGAEEAPAWRAREPARR